MMRRRRKRVMDFVGMRVKKHFKGHGWFHGVVCEAVEVKGDLFGKVRMSSGS